MLIKSADPLFIRINVKLDRIAAEIGKGEKFLGMLEVKDDLEGIPAGDLHEIAARAIALCVHNVYNGFEQVLEDIALEIDGGKPHGENAHADLIDQMSMATPHRPAVVTPEQTAHFDDLRRFRHLFRHDYGIDLRHDEVIGKFRMISVSLWEGFLTSLDTVRLHMESPSDQKDDPDVFRPPCS